LMCCLLLGKLYEKLTLSRGQVAAAAELLARELLEGYRAGSVEEAAAEAARRVGLAAERVEGDEYTFRVSGCPACPGEEFCPAAFFLAAAVSSAIGRGAVALEVGDGRYGVRGEEGCTVRIRVYERRGEPPR